ncbi:molecular chaperone [Atlantibacter subterranea]|uniref:Molecular chaperone n=1 Tax=Atlantibacter subterraneus TaxID=255519 RepID=A0ABU4DWZ6_9ENTR|nr:molecular chaperone [Atlantibacter subterranea]MDV7021378.1 molecular chaperone [Atlantibacter subterranea]MDZ5664524.1 molecular chaperone [Atlantibacter hermannii]
MRGIISFFILFCFNLTLCQAAGIQIGRTRVVYNAANKEVALTLKNDDQELPWLIQAWTDTGDGKTRGPFIVTPPLFRLDPQKEQSLRITWTGAPLPEDRESLFYMNVRTIPATDKEEQQKNVLRLIYKTRLKLFWRPQDLSGTPNETCEHLTFKLTGDRLQVVNAGNFFSVFDSLSIGSTTIRNADMVAPKSTAAFPVSSPVTSLNATWRCITDYGNASKKFTAAASRE